MFRKTKTFTRDGNIKIILKELDELEKEDNIAEKIIKRANWIITISAVCLMLSVFILSRFPSIFVPFFFIFFLMLVISIIKRISYGRLDFEDRKIEIAKNFLQKISEDIPENKRIFLEFNSDGYLKHGKKEVIRRNKINYKDIWFTTKGKLQDGNKFRVIVKQIVRRKEKPKRKYIKINERIQELVSIVLRINRKIYPNINKITKILEPVDIDFGMKITEVKFTESILKVSAF